MTRHGLSLCRPCDHTAAGTNDVRATYRRGGLILPKLEAALPKYSAASTGIWLARARRTTAGGIQPDSDQQPKSQIPIAIA